MSTIVNNRRTASSTKGRQPAPTRNFNQQKKSSFDKPVAAEGVYGDARFTHVVFTLVGMNVQVQVKNGRIYEGIFNTISPQMDVVLEIAHLKVDGNSNSGPTRENIIDKLIFKKDEVVSVTCLSVDLDYAVKDTFTDGAITRSNNGNSYDVELEPWDGETGDELGLEEGESANGWDANEMFKTNQEQFSVKSSYDENLSQYTTVLNKTDTKEWKKREEDARRMAREIERSDEYRKRIDLENGDDEEALFSSVHRTTTTQSGDKKYVPPHVRRNNNNTKGQGNGVDSFQQVQRSNHNKHRQPPIQQQQHQQHHQQHSSSPQHHSPHSPQQNFPPRHQQQILHQQQQHMVQQHQQHQQNQQQQQAPPAVKTTVVHVSCPPSQQPPLQANQASNNNKEDVKIKLNGEENKGAAQADLSIAKSTSQNELSSPKTHTHQQQPESNETNRPRQSNVNKKDKKETFENLKQFSDKFKLEGSEKPGSNTDVDNNKGDTDNKHIDNNNIETKSNEKLDVNTQQSDTDDQSGKKTPAKSVLNPLAKEFTPTNTSSTRAHPAQTPTPPRPQTQSPVVPTIGLQPTMYYPVLQQPPNVNRTYPPTKKAVVSAYPQDYRQAAQHATGQPLLAGTIQNSYPFMVTPQFLPQHHSANSFVMNQHARMMNPGALGPNPTTGIDPNQPNSQHVYMSQQGPQLIQTHMSHPSLQQPQQTHVAHPGPGTPQNQGVQMTQVTGHHPAPSPVQHVQGGQANHPGQVPPTAGTPQPINYPQISLQGHIHGSHNPTSPQTMHASTPYPYNTQYTFSQGQPTSVSHTIPSQMQSTPVHNHVPVVMMPPPSNQQHQFQTHMAGMPGPGHIMHGVPGQGHSHAQVQYVSQMPSQAPQVIQYQQGQ